jgi:alpha-tubulin suppressor-like RCC1 family protein
LTGLEQIAAAGVCTAAVDAGDNFVGWGSNQMGVLTPPAGIQGTVVQVTTGQASTCLLTKTGGVSCFGSNQFGESTAPPTLGKATSVATSGLTACASLAANGGVVCWGAKNVNQTVVPAGLSGVKQVAVGFFAGYGLKGTRSKVPV